MNKKSEELVSKETVLIILTILILISTFVFVGNLLAFTDQSEKSYIQFVNQLEDASSETDSFDLILDKKTAVVFYNKGSDKIIIPILDLDTLNDVSDPNIFKEMNIYISRPNSCPMDKSCVCLCKSLRQDNVYYACQKNKCSVFKNEFTGNCPTKPEETCENGILIEREIFNDAKYYADTGRTIVYFRKEGDKIGIYTNKLTLD